MCILSAATITSRCRLTYSTTATPSWFITLLLAKKSAKACAISEIHISHYTHLSLSALPLRVQTQPKHSTCRTANTWYLRWHQALQSVWRKCNIPTNVLPHLTSCNVCSPHKKKKTYLRSLSTSTSARTLLLFRSSHPRRDALQPAPPRPAKRLKLTPPS